MAKLSERELEANINKIIKVIKSTDCCIITAFRGSDGFTYEENLHRNDVLKSKLDNLGFDYYPVEGHWMEIPDSKQKLPLSKLTREDFVNLSENSFVVVKPEQLSMVDFCDEMFKLMTIEGKTQDCVIIHGKASQSEKLHGDLTPNWNSNHSDLPDLAQDTDIDVNGKFVFMNSSCRVKEDNTNVIRFSPLGTKLKVGKGGDNTSRGYTTIRQKGVDGRPDKSVNFTIQEKDDDKLNESVARKSFKKFLKEMTNKNDINDYENTNYSERYLNNRDFAIISAFRGKLSKEENLKRDSFLKQRLGYYNLSSYSHWGSWKNKKEITHLVPKTNNITSQRFIEMLIDLMTIDNETQDAVVIRLVNPLELCGTQIEPFVYYFLKIAKDGQVKIEKSGKDIPVEKIVNSKRF